MASARRINNKNPIELLARQGNARIFKCFSSDNQVVKEIQKFKTQCRGKYPLLHIAIAEKQTEFAELLLSPSFQVPINAKDANGNTALHIAVENKNFDLFVYLINAGANVSLTNFSGHNIMHLICAPVGKIMEKFFQFLKENLSASLFRKLVQTKSKEGELQMTPLHYAVKNNNFKMVKEILSFLDGGKNNIDPTCIFFAGTIKMVKELELFFGKKIQDIVHEETGDTYLHSMLKRRYFSRSNVIFFGKLFAYIEEKSSTAILDDFLNKRNKDGKTAVYLAISEGSITIACDLIDLGALAVVTEENDGVENDSLQMAIKYRSCRLIQLIVNSGKCIPSLQDMAHFSLQKFFGLEINLFETLIQAAKPEDRSQMVNIVLTGTTVKELAEFILSSSSYVPHRIEPEVLLGQVYAAVKHGYCTNNRHQMFDFYIDKLIAADAADAADSGTRRGDDDKEEFVPVIAQICKIHCGHMLKKIGRYLPVPYFQRPLVIDAILECNSQEFVSVFITDYLRGFDIRSIRHRVKKFQILFLAAQVVQIQREREHAAVFFDSEDEDRRSIRREDEGEGQTIRQKECPICFENKPVGEFVEMYCNPLHSFCHECVGKIIDSSGDDSKCPMCRHSLSF